MSLGFVPRPGERSPWDPAMLVGAWIDAGYDRFPFSQAAMYPYWDPESPLRCEPPAFTPRATSGLRMGCWRS
jgi:hypothetical protein